MRRALLLAGTALLSGALMAPAMASTYHFEKIASIELPGKKGHGDLVAYDPSNHMLYVSMPDDGAVIDTKTNKVVTDLKNIPSPNGMAFDSHYVYWTAAEGAGAGKTNAVVIIDKKTWKEVGRITTKGTSPDGIAIDRRTNTLYVTSDDNNWIEVYSAGEHPQLKATWPLMPKDPKAGPDVGTLVTSHHAIFQPDDAFFERVDTRTGHIDQSVDEQLKLTKHGGTKASIYDARHHRLWVGTTNNEVLVVNASDLKTIAKVPTHGGIDDVEFDPKLGLVYAYGGNGRKGFDVYDAATMKPVAFVSTDVGQTHTGAVNSSNHLVYAYAGEGAVVDVFKPVK